MGYKNLKFENAKDLWRKKFGVFNKQILYIV